MTVNSRPLFGSRLIQPRIEWQRNSGKRNIRVYLFSGSILFSLTVFHFFLFHLFQKTASKIWYCTEIFPPGRCSANDLLCQQNLSLPDPKHERCRTQSYESFFERTFLLDCSTFLRYLFTKAMIRNWLWLSSNLDVDYNKVLSAIFEQETSLVLKGWWTRGENLLGWGKSRQCIQTFINSFID